MAAFNEAYERMIVNEGGYALHQVEGDKGGATYAGIARNAHPEWDGWRILDSGNKPTADDVRVFYRTHYWNPICGDQINSDRIARSIFDFHVNAGRPAIKLAQIVVGQTPDGTVGPKTLDALNAADPDQFVMSYALAKIARYADIVRGDKTQSKFLLGWINRTLKEMA